MAEDISHESILAAVSEVIDGHEIVDYEFQELEDLSMDESHEIELNPNDGTPEIVIISHEEAADTVDRVFEVFCGLELLANKASKDKQCTVYPIFII